MEENSLFDRLTTASASVWDNVQQRSLSTMTRAWGFPRSMAVHSTVIGDPDELKAESVAREKIWQAARDASGSNDPTFGDSGKGFRDARNSVLSSANAPSDQAPLAGQPALCAPNEDISSTHSCPNADDGFGDKFKQITGGMTVEQSISLYKQHTGETLTSDQVERLFTDPDYATVQMSSDENLHKIYRTILNANVPLTKEAAVAAGYRQMSVDESKYHNPLTNPTLNSKYVSPAGYMEAVYGPDGQLVSSLDYIGSFNFFPAENLDLPFGLSTIATPQNYRHMSVDYLPYNKWGN